MRTLPAALAMVLGLAAAVSAEPVDWQRVSADAKWVVHVDVDAMRAGKIPPMIVARWLKLPKSADQLKALSYVIGMDPTRDLQSITVYGRRYTESAGVVVVRADVERDRLEAFLKSRPDGRAASYSRYELISWTDKKGTPDEHTATGCFQQPTVMVFGRDAAEVKHALDVLDGTSPGLPEGDRLRGPQAPAGTMILARACELADVEPFKSPVVRKSKFLSLSIGEYDGEAFAVAGMEADSAPVAGQVEAVAKGFLAMVELQFGSNQEVARLLQAVKVTKDERTVTVQFRGPADDLSKLIDQAWTRQLKLK
jgi:hypothetical protein